MREDDIQIRVLQTMGEREIQGLSDVLIDCVEGGASVSFMLPLSRAKAEAFWSGTAASLARWRAPGARRRRGGGNDCRHGSGAFATA